MIIPILNPGIVCSNTMANMTRYRAAMAVLASVRDTRKRQRLLREALALGDAYRDALASFLRSISTPRQHTAVRRIRHAIARLWQTVQLHLLQKIRPARHPAHLHRVWRITVTHPAIAPPSVA